MKQTAVEWLIKQLYPTISIRLSDVYIKELIDKAKEIEKEQIIDAFIDGDVSKFNETAEKYYSKTFKQD